MLTKGKENHRPCSFLSIPGILLHRPRVTYTSPSMWIIVAFLCLVSLSKAVPQVLSLVLPLPPSSDSLFLPLPLLFCGGRYRTSTFYEHHPPDPFGGSLLSVPRNNGTIDPAPVVLVPLRSTNQQLSGESPGPFQTQGPPQFPK